MNDGSKTTERIYAWLAEDLSGVEGLIAHNFGGKIMPLLATELDLARAFHNLAQGTANVRGKTARLVAFERGVVLDTLEPRTP